MKVCSEVKCRFEMDGKGEGKAVYINTTQTIQGRQGKKKEGRRKFKERREIRTNQIHNKYTLPFTPPQDVEKGRRRKKKEENNGGRGLPVPPPPQERQVSKARILIL